MSFWACAWVTPRVTIARGIESSVVDALGELAGTGWTLPTVITGTLLISNVVCVPAPAPPDADGAGTVAKMATSAPEPRKPGTRWGAPGAPPGAGRRTPPTAWGPQSCRDSAIEPLGSGMAVAPFSWPNAARTSCWPGNTVASTTSSLTGSMLVSAPSATESEAIDLVVKEPADSAWAPVVPAVMVVVATRTSCVVRPASARSSAPRTYRYTSRVPKAARSTALTIRMVRRPMVSSRLVCGVRLWAENPSQPCRKANRRADHDPTTARANAIAGSPALPFKSARTDADVTRMEYVSRSPACSSLVRRDQDWCTLCHADLRPPEQRPLAAAEEPAAPTDTLELLPSAAAALMIDECPSAAAQPAGKHARPSGPEAPAGVP